jgi:predicted nucleic acid-binding protein
MILYLDSSAIVKQYISELGTPEVQSAVEGAQVIGTTVASRVEVTAALRKAVRVGVLTDEQAHPLVRAFATKWPNLIRTRVTERLVKHAAALAWAHSLRGYDAIHLASAAAWQQALGRPVTMATFDQQLWNAGEQIGLLTYPPDLPDLLQTWSKERGKMRN